MDGWIRIGTEIDTKSFDAQIDYIENQMEEIEYKLQQADMGFEVGDVSKLEAQYEKLGMRLTTLKQKQTDLNKTDLSNVQKSIDNVGKSTSSVIKKVAKWSLAVFGIRTAYNAVRSAVSILSQYNEQIASDLEYIKFSLSSALQPVIENLVSWVYKLLNAVNYIAQAWFGVNLFANASADAMEKSSKNAKEMKKSLAGFDEMNTVSSNNSSSSNGGVVNPSVDLSKIQGEVPEWLKWIADNGKLVATLIEWITLAIAGLVAGLPGLILAGIVLQIMRIVEFIQDLITFIQNPSWETFYELLQSFIDVIFGPLGNAINWVLDQVVKNWNGIQQILGDVGQWIYDNIVLPVCNFIQGLFDTIVTIIRTAISVINGIFSVVVGIITNPFIVAKDTILGVFGGVKQFFSGFVQVIKSLFNGDIKGVLNGFKTMFSGIMNSLWSIAKAPLNLIIDGVNTLIKGLNKVSFDVPDWVPSIGGKKLGFNIKTIPKLASGGIINMPGRGVPLAMGGEAGREGVIPLTDSQAMEELGRTIGRYITINATMINQMNGRTISRELMKIQNESAFATNR